MTNRDAIEILEDLKVDVGLSGSFLFEGRAGEIISEALDLSIQALEKQEPKKPITKTAVGGCEPVSYYVCANRCKGMLFKNSTQYCSNCGQAIDWSE